MPAARTAYRIVASTIDAMPVGAVILDKGTETPRVWETINFATGVSAEATGVSVGRVCPTCSSKFKRATALGHHGECGPDVPVFVPSDHAEHEGADA